MKSGLILLTLILLALPISILTSTAATTSNSNTVNWKVTINIVGGSGTLTVIEKEYNASAQEFYTIAQFTVSHSTSFNVPNGTGVILESNESFIVNNQGMVTKIYGTGILSNTTLNVNFNVQNFTFPSSEYSNVTFVLYNSGYLNITVGSANYTVLYTFMTINKTTSLEVPIGAIIILQSNVSFETSNLSFYINYFHFIVEYPKYIIPITFFTYPSTTSTSTSTTTTSSTSTTTSSSTVTSTSTTTRTTSVSPTVAIPPHTGNVTVVSTSTTNNTPTMIILIIVVIVAILVTVYLMLRRR